MENGQTRPLRELTVGRHDTPMFSDARPSGEDYTAFRDKAAQNLTNAALNDLQREWAPARHRSEVSIKLPDSAFADAES